MRRTTNKIPKLHVRRGDLVKVLSGKDRGTTGRVLRVMPTQRKAVVEGVNIITKHNKPTQNNPNGERVQMEAALPVCKLMVVEGGKPTRIGRRQTASGWERYSKKTGNAIPTNKS
jgi:large subunit ribosomal protein L24